MGFLFNKGLGVNAWNSKANTLACIQSQVKVFFNLIDIEILFHIQGSNIDSIGSTSINDLAENNTVFQSVENVIPFWVNGNEFLDILIVNKNNIYQLSEANLFFD